MEVLMEHLHLIKQRLANVREEAGKLWELREKGQEWNKEQKELYSKYEVQMRELAKERDQREAYDREIQSLKPKAEKKFERQTDNISVANLLRHLIYKRTGDSSFKEDEGKISEFTREYEKQYGAFNGEPGGISIPPRAMELKAPQHTRAALNTTTGSEGIVPKIDQDLVYTLYNQTIFNKLGVSIVQIPSGTNEYRKVRTSDPTAQRSSSKSETGTIDDRDLNLTTEYTLKSDTKIGRIVSANLNLLRSLTIQSDFITKQLQMEYSAYFDKSVWWEVVQVIGLKGFSIKIT